MVWGVCGENYAKPMGSVRNSAVVCDVSHTAKERESRAGEQQEILFVSPCPLPAFDAMTSGPLSDATKAAVLKQVSRTWRHK